MCSTRGDVTRETVYIANNGLYVKLTGWTLSDDEGNTYTFPDYGLGGGGAAVNLHTAGGTDTITDLFWNRPMAVWDVGENATLRRLDPASRFFPSRFDLPLWNPNRKTHLLIPRILHWQSLSAGCYTLIRLENPCLKGNFHWTTPNFIETALSLMLTAIFCLKR